MLAIRNEIMRRRLRRLSLLAAEGAAPLDIVPEPADESRRAAVWAM